MCGGLMVNVAAPVLTTVGSSCHICRCLSLGCFWWFSPCTGCTVCVTLPYCKPCRRHLGLGPVPSQLPPKALQISHGFTNAQGNSDQALQGAAEVRLHMP